MVRPVCKQQIHHIKHKKTYQSNCKYRHLRSTESFKLDINNFNPTNRRMHTTFTFNSCTTKQKIECHAWQKQYVVTQAKTTETNLASQELVTAHPRRHDAPNDNTEQCNLYIESACTISTTSTCVRFSTTLVSCTIAALSSIQTACFARFILLQGMWRMLKSLYSCIRQYALKPSGN